MTMREYIKQAPHQQNNDISNHEAISWLAFCECMDEDLDTDMEGDQLYYEVNRTHYNYCVYIRRHFIHLAEEKRLKKSEASQSESTTPATIHNAQNASFLPPPTCVWKSHP